MPADPSPPRHRDPEATQEALIDAGARLFAERGFAGATIDAIAREAGVNKAMISYHFGGKEGLYRAILTSGLSEAAGRMTAFADAPRDVPAAELLGRFIESMAATFAHRPTLPLLIQHEALAGGEALDREAFPYMVRILEVLGGIVDRGTAQGVFRPVHPMLLHFQIVGTLLLYFATRPLRDRFVARGGIPVAQPTLDEMVRHIHESLVHGLAPDRRN